MIFTALKLFEIVVFVTTTPCGQTIAACTRFQGGLDSPTEVHFSEDAYDNYFVQLHELGHVLYAYHLSTTLSANANTDIDWWIAQGNIFGDEYDDPVIQAHENMADAYAYWMLFYDKPEKIPESWIQWFHTHPSLFERKLSRQHEK